MKHSQIIQANLDKRLSKIEKTRYLIYAYKEWIIGIAITMITLLIFLFSMLTTKLPDLSIRLISDESIELEVLDSLLFEFQQNLDDGTLIDIQNYIISNIDQQQMLLAQLAAKEVDLFIVSDKASQETLLFVNEVTDEQNIFYLNTGMKKFSISRAINAPNKELIDSLKKSFFQ